MIAQRAGFLVFATVLAVAACGERDASRIAAPSFAVGGIGRPVVLVNPNAADPGTAKTIQDGIDKVADGGRVLVLPGTYHEAIVIDKGLTLEAVGGESGPVVIEPEGVPLTAVQIATPNPVVIRGLTIHAVPSTAPTMGIRGVGTVVDVTVERTTVRAINPPLGVSNLIDVDNHNTSGPRARLVVRQSFLDGGVSFERSLAPPFPQVFALRTEGDVDTRFEGNVIRRTGGACVLVISRNDLGGSMNVDIVDNDLDECYPLGRVGAIIVGPPTPAPAPPAPPGNMTATGTVNIVGNTIRNSTGSCLPATAIHYEYYSGRIEHNRIVNVVQECATANARTHQAAIWIGFIRRYVGAAAAPIIRFNDIEG